MIGFALKKKDESEEEIEGKLDDKGEDHKRHWNKSE